MGRLGYGSNGSGQTSLTRFAMSRTIRSFLLSIKPILIRKLNLIHSPLHHMNFENLSFNSIESQKDTLNWRHKQIQIIRCFSEKPITFGTIVGNWNRHSCLPRSYVNASDIDWPWHIIAPGSIQLYETRRKSKCWLFPPNCSWHNEQC